jgi:hypothetical protein
MEGDGWRGEERRIKRKGSWNKLVYSGHVLPSHQT